MANLRLAYKNSVDHPACVLTTTVTPILPLDNLKNYKRGRILRYPAADGQFISATFGGNGVRCSMAALCRHNLEPAATWRFRGYSDPDWTTEVIDTGDLVAVDSSSLGSLDWGVAPLGSGVFDPFYGQKMSTAYFDETLLLSWTIEISDAGNSSGFIELSRVWVGAYFELAENPEYGLIMGWVEKSETWRSDGGSPHCDGAIPYRGGSFDLRYIVEADRAQWMDITRYCGLGRRDLFMSVRPDDTNLNLKRDYEGVFIFQGELPRPAYSEFERYDAKVTVEET